MTEETAQQLFARIRAFGWHETKRRNNLRVHKIDFEDVKEIFDGYTNVRRSDMAKSDIKSSGTSMAGKLRSSARSAAISAGSSRRGERPAKNGKNITIVSRDDPRRGKTDWARVDALTDEEIEAAVRKDSDAVPLDFDWSEAVLVIPPKKKAISIRVDEDVLNYFKKHGAGYQRRINAVLRSFVDQKRKPPSRKKHA